MLSKMVITKNTQG